MTPVSERISRYRLWAAVVTPGEPLSAAIALSMAGVHTALIARRAPYSDNRTTALLGASVDFLQSLEVWPRCQDQAAAQTWHAQGEPFPPGWRSGFHPMVLERGLWSEPRQKRYLRRILDEA